MHDLSKSWTEETIALLLNKRWTASIADRHQGNEDTTHQKATPTNYLEVEFVDFKKLSSSDGHGGGLCAKLTFASPEESQQVRSAYEGLPIPMTHGYHFYRFSNDIHQESGDGKLNADNSSGGPNQTNESLSDSTHQSSGCAPTPPLHLQLMALSTSELERRLQEYTKATTDEIVTHSGASFKCRKKKKSNKKDRVLHHAQLAAQLTQYIGCARPAISIRGAPVSSFYTQPLLEYLRKSLQPSTTPTLWPPSSKQRRGVQSGHYLTVRQSHPPHQHELWELCRKLLRATCAPEIENNDDINNGSGMPDYTALAITHAFRGSPHIDAHDTTHQYVIALGNFVGGELCADNFESVVEIDVRNRLGRLEGRQVHWVKAWSGERFSIVYYSTNPDHETPIQCQQIHNEWMLEKNRNHSQQRPSP